MKVIESGARLHIAKLHGPLGAAESFKGHPGNAMAADEPIPPARGAASHTAVKRRKS